MHESYKVRILTSFEWSTSFGELVDAQDGIIDGCSSSATSDGFSTVDPALRFVVTL